MKRLTILGAALALCLAPAFGQVTNYPAGSVNETTLKGTARTFTARQAFNILGVPTCAPDPPVGACTTKDLCYAPTTDRLYICDATAWVIVAARLEDDPAPKLDTHLDLNGKYFRHEAQNEYALALDPYTLGLAAWPYMKNGNPATGPGNGPQIRPDAAAANVDLRISALGTGTVRFEKAISADNGINCTDCIALTSETTGNYAAGDAEAGNATGLACTTCVDTSSETNLAVSDPITLTGDTVGFRESSICQVIAIKFNPDESLDTFQDLYLRDAVTDHLSKACLVGANCDGFGMPRAGVVSDIAALVGTAVASGQWVVHVMEDGVSRISCTISSGTTCTSASSATVAAGSFITVKTIPTGPPTAATAMNVSFCIR